MSISTRIFRKKAIERGFRYMIKPEYPVSFVGKDIVCSVRDISIGGIGLLSSEFTKLVAAKEEIQASIRIGEEILTLDVEVVWARGDRAGLKIITHKEFYSNKVKEFIELLHA